MPRKPTTSKESMIQAAFELVRRSGYEALTARSLAAELGCSTQPIMYRFPDLSELRQLVYQKADAYHTEYILATPDLLEMGLRYVRFAAEEPALFRLLFQSGHFDGARLPDMVRAPEAEPILRAASAQLGLDPATAAAAAAEADAAATATATAFEALFVAVHGYASLVANNAMTYDPAAIQRTLTAVAQGLARKDKDA